MPEIKLQAWHSSDSISELFVEVENERLLYKRPDSSLAFYADATLSYLVYTEPDTHRPCDSGVVSLSDRAESEQVKRKALRGQCRLKLKRGQSYRLEAVLSDHNRKTRYKTGLEILKQDEYRAQNFLVKRNDSVCYRYYFEPGQNVTVYAGNAALSRVKVDYFKKDFGPALPPFSTKTPEEGRFKPDSSFELAVVRGRMELLLPPKGFYHLHLPESEEGLSLFTVDKSFPEVGSSAEMILCTRYIMERNEYETCRDAPEAKAAIDNFWLGLAGSHERARELIKRYYGRVNEANRFYSSYVPGWKSDRGMIYIVFGTPSQVYSNRNDEIWVYGNETNPAALRFTFNKARTPFSANDYVLERSVFFKEAWYGAVEYWRQGSIYFDGRR